MYAQRLPALARSIETNWPQPASLIDQFEPGLRRGPVW